MTAAFAATGSIQYNGHEICTASLVSPTMIVSAAHCFNQASADQIRQSEFVLGIDTANSKVRAHLDWAMQHPGYDNQDFVYDGPDVAVAALQTAITAVQPVVLHPSNPADLIGQDMILVGYGRAADEQSGSSSRRYATVSLAGTNNTKVYYEFKGTGACNGDSGGPAFIEVDGGWRQVGITSGGDKSCKQNGYYTRVDVFADWFQEHGVPAEAFEDRARHCELDDVCDGLCEFDDDCRGLMCADGTCEEPGDDEPVDDEPVDDAPVDDEPVDDEPVDDEPVDDEPVDEEPVCSTVTRTVQYGYCFYWDANSGQYCGAYPMWCYPSGCYCPF